MIHSILPNKPRWNMLTLGFSNTQLIVPTPMPIHDVSCQCSFCLVISNLLYKFCYCYDIVLIWSFYIHIMMQKQLGIVSLFDMALCKLQSLWKTTQKSAYDDTIVDQFLGNLHSKKHMELNGSAENTNHNWNLRWNIPCVHQTAMNHILVSLNHESCRIMHVISFSIVVFSRKHSWILPFQNQIKPLRNFQNEFVEAVSGFKFLGLRVCDVCFGRSGLRLCQPVLGDTCEEVRTWTWKSMGSLLDGRVFFLEMNMVVGCIFTRSFMSALRCKCWAQCWVASVHAREVASLKFWWRALLPFLCLNYHHPPKVETALQAFPGSPFLVQMNLVDVARGSKPWQTAHWEDPRRKRESEPGMPGAKRWRTTMTAIPISSKMFFCPNETDELSGWENGSLKCHNFLL